MFIYFRERERERERDFSCVLVLTITLRIIQYVLVQNQIIETCPNSRSIASFLLVHRI